MTAQFESDEVISATGARCVRRGRAVRFQGVCLDTRKPQAGALFVALRGERFDAHAFLSDAVKSGAVGVVVERAAAVGGFDAPVWIFEVENTLRALSGLALWHRRRFHLPIGAVTGSNGKTSTKELVASILATRGSHLKTAGNLNNEVGVPLTLFGLSARHQSAVIEMGMNHLGEIDRLAAMTEPDAGLITVVQPAHLEGVGSIEGVAEAKTELFRRLNPSAVAVVNVDDHRIVERSSGLHCQTLTFGRAAHAEVRLVEERLLGAAGQQLTIEHEHKRFVVDLKLLGRHNALNAVGAFALARALGFSSEHCTQGLSSAVSHAQRLELKKTASGLVILDDCYNANPQSMVAAIDTLVELTGTSRSFAVLGDMLELGSAEDSGHAEVVDHAAAKASTVVLLGKRMHAAAGRAAHRNVHCVDDVNQAVVLLQAMVRPSEAVLVKASRGMKLERVVEALMAHDLPSSSDGAVRDQQSLQEGH
jgi:UDP-N-acetylmuramoyl-tripeptide--D-alanyl-D-alanine ligase